MEEPRGKQKHQLKGTKERIVKKNNLNVLGRVLSNIKLIFL